MKQGIKVTSNIRAEQKLICVYVKIASPVSGVRLLQVARHLPAAIGILANADYIREDIF